MSTSFVVDTSKSPGAKLVPVPLTAVKLSAGSFWDRYFCAVRKKSLPRLFEDFEKKGILDNLRRISGKIDMPRRGTCATDSDLAKWMEGTAYALAAGDDATLRGQLETSITEFIDAQSPDGYLNSYFTDPAQRFTDPDKHEMYCAGHYFQAAVAIHRCLGDRRTLNSAIRYADYLYNRFGPGRPERWACGHPEIEMALIELSRETGEAKYQAFARHILDQLNIDASWKTGWSRDITVPFVKRQTLIGHSVRNLYLACAGTDLWMETGDPKLERAVRRLWNRLIRTNIYVTGGVGGRYQHEAIGQDYELPNLQAYSETCAAIGNVMWNFRNLLVTGEAAFADWMERSLYNGVLSGISLDGAEYFYVNPLTSFGNHRRTDWYDCTCCPTNLVRMLASIPGYIYATDADGLWVHLYDSNTADITRPNGDKLRLTQETQYPFDGRVKIKLELDQPNWFTLNLRIPGWTDTFTFKLNGKTQKNKPLQSGYLAVHRVWNSGDVVELNLPMDVRTIRGNPRALDTFGRLALMRGPLVYCLESTDNPDLPSVHLAAIGAKPSAKMIPAKAFNKVPIPALLIHGREFQPEDALYRPAAKHTLKTKPAVLTAIPYFAWANRGKSEMTVWIPTLE